MSSTLRSSSVFSSLSSQTVGTEAELWLKYKSSPSADHMMPERGRVFTKPHPAQAQAPQPALLPRPCCECAYWPTQASSQTKGFTAWKAILESCWEAVSRSCPQHCPAWPRPRNDTSPAAGLGQSHFYREHWCSGKAARLVTAAYKKGIQQ